MAQVEKNCTVLFDTEKISSVQQEDIMKDLESADARLKANAIKQTILMMLSGEQLPRVLMSVIRYCINTEDHALKKLLMVYWEVVPKHGPDKKLLPEMILVCNALRNDLTHPNEYIRGSMLRFLCKLREAEILEPLVPSVKANLEHRHSYVRRNAALAIYHIHHYAGAHLVPDAPELISRFIADETDVGCRRNAFLFLCNEAETLALDFLEHNMDDIGRFGDGFGLLVLELTRRVCRADPNLKGRFVRCLFSMMSAQSPGVAYEAAWTLVSLTTAPTAVRAAASTFAELVCSQGDNNVKLIILERLNALKRNHSKVLQEVLMDILRALNSPNLEICEKTLEVAMDLVTPRNILEVVTLLKKEVQRTQENDMDKAAEYRRVLIRSIHQCATRFPDVAEGVVHTLMEFLDTDGALDVVLFVRAIVEQYPDLRPSLLRKLMDSLGLITVPNVLSVALWILGQYALTADEVDEAFECITEATGDAPFEEVVADSRGDLPKEGDTASVPQTTTRTMVLADGTYASQTVVSETANAAPVLASEGDSFLRRQLIMGEHFLAACVAASLTKLCLRAFALLGESSSKAKEMQIKSLLIMCGMAMVNPVADGTTGAAVPSSASTAMAKAYADSRESRSGGAYEDCRERIRLCSRLLLDPALRQSLGASWLTGSRQAFAELLEERRSIAQSKSARNEEAFRVEADELIHFRQLRPPAAAADLDMIDGDDMSKATGADANADGASKLSRVYQLSSIADPIYAEAQVTVHDYDIILDITVTNRT
mmetsp:Transcript_19640/g.74319  ORF Transcript_19640/g.74319 Transcript_19640/m.74319 type:complete len:771 (-) Transcript_19640:11-2323(-)